MTSPTPDHAPAPAPPVPATRHWRLPPARSLLGGLLVAMAAGQLSDVGGFARILDTYQLLPRGGCTAAAWAFVTAETTAGAALLRGKRCGAALSVAVALAWTVLGTQAFARGLTIDNCGCFGVHLGQPLRWWVLLEDAELIALATWVRRAERRTPPHEPEPRSCPPCSRPPALAGRRERSG